MTERERRAKGRAYHAANPHIGWRSNYKRRARAFGVTPIIGEPFTRADVIARYGELCRICGGPFEHLDHVIPISAGGPHALSNVQPLCAECNAEKSKNERKEVAK